MAISFPIAFPSIRGIAAINWRAVRADILTASPFSFAQQVIQHPGQRWEADITLPEMNRAEADEFVSFLLQLDGRNGTFTLSPPGSGEARGSASTTPGTPVIAGASQTGSTLDIDGLPLSATGYFLAGDYIQLGSGATATLHKVVSDTDSDGTGAATLDIWPDLRSSPADGATVIVSEASGVFRLATPVAEFAIDGHHIFGITFSIIEAL